MIAGGCPDKSAEIYDASTNRFSPVEARTNISRSFHEAVLLSTGDVLLAGGIGFYNGDTAEIFNARDLQFSPTRNWLFANRLRPSLRLLPDGKVQIVGGDREGTMELYNPKTNRFRSQADISAAAAAFPMSQMLRARTRTAIIQGAMNLQRGKDHRQLSVSNDSQDASGESIARADYSYCEIGHLNRAVIAGGVDCKGRLLRSVVLLESSPSTLTTDYVEYAQQSNQHLQQASPLIMGAGWIPNEEITIVRQQTETEASIVLHSVADAQGGFTNSDIPDNQLGVYILTAVGQSSHYVAQTTYRVAPAPDLESEAAIKFKKPVRIKALIPLGGSGGTVQTDLGPMNWKATSLNNVKISKRVKNEVGAKARKPLTPMIEDLDAEASNQVNIFSFDLAWSNVPLSIPSFPVSVNNSGMFSGRGFIEVTASFEGPDCDCCWCFPPCSCSLASVHTNVAFVVAYDLTTTNDITFEGEFIKNDILVLPILEIGAVIPGSPFSLGGVFGLFAGVDLRADRRLTVRTVLNVSDTRLRAGVDAGFTLIGIPPGPTIRPILEVDPGSVGGDASLIEFGDVSAKLSLGPGVQAILNLGHLPIIGCELELSSTLRAAPFVKATVAPTADSDTCQKFDINIGAGLQGDFTGQYFGCGLVSASFHPEFEFFEVPIVSFGPFVFKIPAHRSSVAHPIWSSQRTPANAPLSQPIRILKPPMIAPALIAWGVVRRPDQPFPKAL